MPLTFQLLENEGLASSCRCRKATSRSTRRAASPAPRGLIRAPAPLYTWHLLAPPPNANLGLVTTTPAWTVTGAQTSADEGLGLPARQKTPEAGTQS